MGWWYQKLLRTFSIFNDFYFHKYALPSFRLQEELIERITRKVEELCNNQREVRQEIEDVEDIGR